MTDNTQPEALRLADTLDLAPENGIEPQTAEDAAAELRRQHTRIAELEAQLESIGAGGVSGPLMGRTDSKERDAFERALMDLAAQHGETVSTSDLSRDASGAYDNGMTEIAWMLWQARASIAASAGSVEPAGEYPALPEPDRVMEDWSIGGVLVDYFTTDQMRAYADATCAIRAVQPASGLDPELGPMLDFANAGEIAFYDYAVAQHCRATLDILDGKDNGAGACNEPWASVRKRLLSIVESHQSSSATQWGFAPAGAQQPGDERAAFEQWSKVTNQGYDLARNVSGKPQTFESTETEHAWRGFFHGLRASHGQAPAQAAPAEIRSYIAARAWVASAAQECNSHGLKT